MARAKDSFFFPFAPKMIFALDLHSPLPQHCRCRRNRRNYFQFAVFCSSLANYREVGSERGGLRRSSPMHFKCHFDEMSRGSPFPPLALSKVFSGVSRGNDHQCPPPPVECVRLVMQCQLHQSSVMPRRSALSDDGDVGRRRRPSASRFLEQTDNPPRTPPLTPPPPGGAGGFCVREAECQLLSELRGQKASGTAACVGAPTSPPPPPPPSPRNRKWLRETRSQLSPGISMSDSLATFPVTRTCISTPGEANGSEVQVAR